jgi:hypothetical protein
MVKVITKGQQQQIYRYEVRTSSVPIIHRFGFSKLYYYTSRHSVYLYAQHYLNLVKLK